MKYTRRAILPDNDRLAALQYFSAKLEGSVLFAHLPPRSLQSECLDVSLVCSDAKSYTTDYEHGFGGRAAGAFNWLIEELQCYLQADMLNIGIVEDTCALPTDPGLDSYSVSFARPAQVSRVCH
jgi:hypothetical protein